MTTCATCRFFGYSDTANGGAFARTVSTRASCFRYPPAVSAGELVAEWKTRPTVSAASFCGEHQEQKDAAG